MPGYTVDGNDPLAMFAAAHDAITRARDGEGPTLLECKTFRFHGHVLGDDDKYMTKEEKAEAIAKDPLPAFKAWLIEKGHATEETMATMQATIEAEIEDAQEFGLNSPLPSVDELRRDVFAQEIPA